VLPAWGQTQPEIKEAPARPPPSRSPDDEFVQIDTDHDGRISATEYAASPRSAIDRIAAGKRQGPAGVTGGFDLRNNEGRPDRSKFFRKLDKNRDGYLSRSELGLPERPPTEGKEVSRQDAKSPR
jgi:Ca2+-binding EF-hand superfamily protein